MSPYKFEGIYIKKFVRLLRVDIKQARIRIKTYHGRLIGHFKTKTRNVIEQSKKYLLGCLTVSKRGTMVEMSKSVPDCNNQSIQHFISNSLWDEQGLIYQIQEDVAYLIGDKENGSLIREDSYQAVISLRSPLY